MATSSEAVRAATSPLRPLADLAFEALREAVIVVDTRRATLPVVLANASARRCVLREADSDILIDSPLDSLVEDAAAAVATVLELQAGGVPSPARTAAALLPRCAS